MDEIESPCVRNCCLDQNDICLGCFRTLDEITQWGDSSNEQKLQILDNAERRRAEREKP